MCPQICPLGCPILCRCNHRGTRGLRLPWYDNVPKNVPIIGYEGPFVKCRLSGAVSRVARGGSPAPARGGVWRATSTTASTEGHAEFRGVFVVAGDESGRRCVPIPVQSASGDASYRGFSEGLNSGTPSPGLFAPSTLRAVPARATRSPLSGGSHYAKADLGRAARRARDRRRAGGGGRENVP